MGKNTIDFRDNFIRTDETTGGKYFDDMAYGQALKSNDDGKLSKIKSIESQRNATASAGMRQQANDNELARAHRRKISP